jgi:hypothetical protein
VRHACLNAQRVLLAVCADDRRNRTEQLFARDRVLIGHVCKNVRRKNLPFGLSAGKLSEARLARFPDALLQALQLAFVDDRPDYSVRLVRVAIFQMANPVFRPCVFLTR